MAANTIFGKGVLTIGTTAAPTDDVSCQVGSFVVSSNANIVPIPATLCEGPGQYATPSTFSVTVTYQQDFGSTPSLSETLFANDGLPIFLLYIPTDAAVPQVEIEVYGVAGDYGGEGQGLWVSTEDMPALSPPVFTAQA
jgi:hypothetical protein